MSFTDLGLAPVILSALNQAGFTAPTSVQAAAIPPALAAAYAPRLNPSTSLRDCLLLPLVTRLSS